MNDKANGALTQYLVLLVNDKWFKFNGLTEPPQDIKSTLSILLKDENIKLAAEKLQSFIEFSECPVSPYRPVKGKKMVDSSLVLIRETQLTITIVAWIVDLFASTIYVGGEGFLSIQR